MATLKKPKRSLRGPLAIATSTLLGVIAVLLAAFDPLWSFLDVDPQLRAAQATGIAILFINAGFLLAMYFHQADFKDELLGAQKAQVSALISSMPRRPVFNSSTGDEAMEALVALLPTALSVRNTRILSPTMSLTSWAKSSPWDVAIRKAVRGGLTFREIVSRGNEELVRARSNDLDNARGRYEASILDHSLPSFLNFIVLERRGGAKEVWFGWAVTRGSGFEGPVIRTDEETIVLMFERWHAELFAVGQPPPPLPAES